MTDLFSPGDSPLSLMGAHLWNGCVQGTLALALVFAVCRLFPRVSPNTTSWLWRIAFLKLLVAFAYLGAIPVPVADSPSSGPAAAVRIAATAGSHVWSVVAPISHRPETRSVVPILVMAWYIGAIVSGIRIAWASHRTRLLRRTCRIVDDYELRSVLADLCRTMGIRRAPQLMVGDVIGPLTCGLLSPCIILPDREPEEHTLEESRLILAHELAHVKRHDVLWAWLPMLAQWFFFFNPMLWPARKEWVFAQEAASDAMAVETSGTSCAHYARMLLTHTMRVSISRRFGMAGIFGPYESLKRRLTAMSNAGTTTRRKRVVVAVIITLIAAIGLIPWVAGVAKRSRETEIFAYRDARGMYSLGASEWNVHRQPKWRWHAWSPYHRGISFLGLEDKPVSIYYLCDMNRYRVIGRAEIRYPDGETQIAENRDVDAPGPPDSNSRTRPIRRPPVPDPSPAHLVDTLARSAYSGDARSVRVGNMVLGVGKLIHPRVQSYGPVKDVVLEAEGRILPGLTGKGARTREGAELPIDRAYSTWRVHAERGEYRLATVMERGRLIGYMFNLADGGYGSGTY